MVRDRTLYISLDMPPDLDTKPTEPGLCSLHAAMLSSVPAVSPIRKAPACTSQQCSCIATPYKHTLLAMPCTYRHSMHDYKC